MKLFLDTNVVLDFLAERDPFFEDASVIFDMWRLGMVKISFSALTVVNCAYILRKRFDNQVMLDKVNWMCQNFEITPIEKSCIATAAQMEPHDIEDAVQLVSSRSCYPDVIITRDQAGFADFGVKLMTPSEFVESCKQ